MTTEEMAGEFASVSGKYLIIDLILSLNELQSKDPSFALAAAPGNSVEPCAAPRR